MRLCSSKLRPARPAPGRSVAQAQSGAPVHHSVGFAYSVQKESSADVSFFPVKEGGPIERRWLFFTRALVIRSSPIESEPEFRRTLRATQ